MRVCKLHLVILLKSNYLDSNSIYMSITRLFIKIVIFTVTVMGFYFQAYLMPGQGAHSGFLACLTRSNNSFDDK
jgi:hypothetical protein